MSDVQLLIIASITLSLAFSYLPGLREAYAAKSPTYKRLVMLILLALVTVGAFSLSCFGLGEPFHITVECSKAGAVSLLQMFVLAITSNQATFLLSP